MSVLKRRWAGRTVVALAISVTWAASAADFSTWQRALPITFTGYNPPGGATPLTNFPALVVLSTNISGFSYGNFLSFTNQDLRFADSLSNELPYEIETWNTNGSSYVWLQVTNLVDASTYVWAYWGKSSITAPAYTTNGAVWSPDYRAVWHLKTNGAALTPADSTTNKLNGTTNGACGPATGYIGGGAGFGGGYIGTGTTSPNSTQGSICVWMYATNGLTNRCTIFDGGAQNTPSLEVGRQTGALPNSSNGVMITEPGYYYVAEAPTSVVSTGRWYHIVYTYNTNHVIYINGMQVPVTNNSAAPAYVTTASTKEIGNRSTGTQPFYGFLDELRVATVAESANYVWASWLNQASNGVFAGSFNTYGTVQAQTASANPPQISNGVSLNLSNTSATVVGILTTNGSSAASIYLYRSTTDGTTNPATWLAGGSVTNLGGVANGATFTNTLTGLNPNTTYYWNYSASNQYGTAWAATGGSPYFKTFGPPAVNNGIGPNPVGATNATLNGNLANGVQAGVRIFWGTDSNNWANTSDFGVLTEGPFFTNLTGLSQGATYYYQCQATNAYGIAWSVVTNFTTPVFQGDYYVTPTGSGAGSGTNWANAFSNIQSAVALCTSPGVTIHLQYGTYLNASAVAISNVPGVTIRGGYAGLSPEPGPFTNSESVITRAATVTNRIVYGYCSTVTLDRVTVSNGLLFVNTAGAASSNLNGGAGLWMTNCVLALTNCVLANNAANSDTANNGVFSGGALWLRDCATLIDNSILRNNQVNSAGESAANPHLGGAIYAVGGQLTIRNSSFFTNRVTGAGWGTGWKGGGIATTNALVTLTNCLFDTCSINCTLDRAIDGSGGAVSVQGGSVAVSGCTFNGNYARLSGPVYGGAICGANASVTLNASTFTRNHVAGWTSGGAGGTVYLTGCPSVGISGCQLQDNVGPEVWWSIGDVWLQNCATTMMNNCQMVCNAGSGVTLAGGKLWTTNCLMGSCGSNGVTVSAGTGVFVNCTFADNMGWGVSQAGGSVTVSNSIAWRNLLGGISVTNGTVAYTCFQEAQSGGGNLNTNPLLIYGYFLSKAGQYAQPNSSPCIGAGGVSAASLGLDTLTTATDGTKDNAGNVALGYHYPAGATFDLRNLVLYVDPVAGSDGNNGWAAGAGNALKTLTTALAKAVPGTTINLATGTCSTATGEVFPLVPLVPNLSLIGANRDTTIISGDAANKKRVLHFLTKGHVVLQGLTIRNGSVSGVLEYGAGSLGAGYGGGGVYLANCDTLIQNCALVSNTMVNAGTTAHYYGGGALVSHGRLQMLNSMIQSNRAVRNTTAGTQVEAGGLYSELAILILSNTVFQGNAAETGHNIYGYSGGLFVNNGSLSMVNCAFVSNSVANMDGDPAFSIIATGYAGALHAMGVNPLWIYGCTFTGNSTRKSNSGPKPVGGLMRFEGASLNGTLALCDLYANGGPTISNNADIYIGAGTLSFTNVLIANDMGCGLLCAGTSASTVSVVNCTLANNNEWGLSNGAAIVTLRNGIVWGNANGVTNATTATYTDSQNPLAGTGNISADPLFVNAGGGDYHEQSQGDSWHGGLWIHDSQTSPCVDAGDPNDLRWQNEPYPNGKRINMGRYGGTDQASMAASARGTLMIVN